VIKKNIKSRVILELKHKFCIMGLAIMSVLSLDLIHIKKIITHNFILGLNSAFIVW
jgi:hypothetical protein